MPTDRGPLVWLLVVALVAGAAGPGVAVGAGVDSNELSPQQETPTNATVRHEDPDTVDRAGNLEDLERWLAGRLSERLGNSTIAISRGQYERARSVLGAGYSEQLDRYVELAEETSGSDDDEAVESFRSAQNSTRTFANRTDRFERTLRAYERASERGDEARARELARQLIRQARAANESATRVERDFRQLRNQTGVEVNETITTVGTVSQNVTERADEVATATFTRTRLSANATPSTVSFRSPATVSGRLVTANGTGLADRRIIVGHASEAVTMRTNGSGWFEATYRPVKLPVEPGVIPVRYVPVDDAVYLGNRTNVSVDVQQVQPTISVSIVDESLAFGDDVTVRGSVNVDGVGVERVPVRVSVGGVGIDRVTTDDSGYFVVSRSLPAGVPPGNRTIPIEVDQTGRSVGAGTTTTPISVTATETVLTANASVAVNGSVSVTGRLRTVDGLAVDGQPVQLQVNDAPAGTVQTDGSGGFSMTMPPSAYEPAENGSVAVDVRFEGRGNLRASSDSVTVEPDTSGGGQFAFPLNLGFWLLFIAVVLLLVAGIALWGRFVADDAEVEDDQGTTPTTPTSTAQPVGETWDWQADVESLLAADETDRAVATAYGAARRRLTSELGLDGALTHWEVYAACADDGMDEERVGAVRALTEAYERAQFAPDSLSAGEAEAAVERASAILTG